MAKSFADDGASGAGGAPGASGSFGSSAPPPASGGVDTTGLGDTASSSDFSGAGALISDPQTSAAGPTQISDAQALQMYGPGALGNGALAGLGSGFEEGGGGGGGSSSAAPKKSTAAAPANDGIAQTFEGAGGGNQASVAGQNTFFDAGGSVPDDGSDQSTNLVQQALQAVDQGMAYGQKKYGLDQGEQQGGVQEAASPGPQAANMPTVPASQSNSGLRPQQPMPGPLPPTSNPFGQRADAGGVDTDDQENAS
jgi:hypothetical protein